MRKDSLSKMTTKKTQVEDKVYIIVFGSVAAGYNFIGPFNSKDEAEDWALLQFKNKLSYEVVPLKNPT